MSQTFILKTDGQAVTLPSDFSAIIVDIRGFLSEFAYKANHYKFRSIKDFKKKDQRKIGLIGYFNESVFKAYIQSADEEIHNTIEVKKTKFIFDDFLSKAGEQIVVTTLDFGPPFNVYYKRKKATFNIEKDLRSGAVKLYRDAVKDEIQIPVSATLTQDIRPLNDTPRRYFFNKNFGSVVNSWTISDDEKKQFCEVTTLMAFYIYDIEKELFPKFISSSALSALEDDVLSRSYTDISDLNVLKQTIFTLKKVWGYYYTPNNNLPHREDFQAILPAVPDYPAFLAYFQSLVSFYKAAYSLPEDFLSYPEENRVVIPLEVFPHSALSIIPYEIRIAFLERFIKKGFLPERAENVVINIIQSIANQDADRFLDFLLLQNNGTNSNFEILYENMDDQRLKRYPLISWFITEASNRKYFTKGIYELWKVSKYNSTYIPVGVTPIEHGRTNPNAYFITDPGNKYFDRSKNYVLEFEPEKKTSYDSYIYSNSSGTKISFQSEIIGTYLKVNRVTEVTSVSSTLGSNTVDTNTKAELFGNYHLYLPISLVGYKPDAEVEMPQVPIVPAFLFHYAEEFERIKDFDAALSLVADITLEAVIFYFTGGTSIIKDLRYLKYANKFGKALRGAIPPTEIVEVWRGLEGAGQVISVQSSVLSSASNYIAVTEHDPDKRQIALWMSSFFFWLSLGTGTTAGFARFKAARAAEEVLIEINSMPVNIPHGLSQETINLLYAVKSSKDVSLTLFRSKLNTLDFGTDVNRIISRFDLFTDTEKLIFYRNYSSVEDINEWIKFNKERSRIINGQSYNYTLVDTWKTDIQFLKKYRSITFLENFDIVINHERLQKHTHIGHAGIDNNGKAYVTGAHNVDLMDNLLWKWSDENAIISKNGYKHGKVQRDMSDFNWTGGNPPTSWKTKKNPTTMWKKFTNDPVANVQRINEEMALAMTNKKLNKTQLVNGKLVDIYHGFASDGKKIEVVYEHLTGILTTIYPYYPF